MIITSKAHARLKNDEGKSDSRLESESKKSLTQVLKSHNFFARQLGRTRAHPVTRNILEGDSNEAKSHKLDWDSSDVCKKTNRRRLERIGCLELWKKRTVKHRRTQSSTWGHTHPDTLPYPQRPTPTTGYDFARNNFQNIFAATVQYDRGR